VLELIAVDIDGEYAFVLNEYSDFVPPGMEGKRVVLVSVLDDREDEGVVFACAVLERGENLNEW